MTTVAFLIQSATSLKTFAFTKLNNFVTVSKTLKFTLDDFKSFSFFSGG